MSEDDRAAKAARAKAMLKKRQQQKKAAEPLPSPSSPTPSRTFSPAPPEPVAEDKRDLGDIFTKDDPNDTSWLNSLPRAPSVPPSAENQAVLEEPSTLKFDKDNPTKQREEFALASGRQNELLETANRRNELHLGRITELQAEQERLQQTITLLVSEKSSLGTQLDRLEGIETTEQATQALLTSELNRSRELERSLHHLQAEVQSISKQNQDLVSRVKHEADRAREQERELQLTKAEIHGLRKGAENHLRRIRELEEHIESDDRAEQLERALKNAQDRADELEFEHSKLKQNLSDFKTQRDQLDERLKSEQKNGTEWKTRHDSLLQTHSDLQQQMSATTQKNHLILEQKGDLQAKTESAEQEITLLKTKFTEAAEELASSTRQLRSLQLELKLATRRADDAERIQKDLQSEGTDLMRSLEEMRPKIVELTANKVDLIEKTERLASVIRSRDTTIASLESTVTELTEKHAHEKQEWQTRFSQQDKEQTQSTATSTQLQDAYSDLQKELDLALSSIRTLETERSNYHQEATRRLQEIENLTSASTAQFTELSALRQEVDEFRLAQVEEKDLLERAQNEVEALRFELGNRDAELEHLREVVSSPTQSGPPRSLDEEMLNSLKQQHSLEVSALQSRLRGLETALFEAQAQGHSVKKQLNVLQSRVASQPVARSFSPVGRPNSRPASRNHSTNRLGQQPAARAIIEQTLSDEARHKRKVSLSMLRARIESETAVTLSHPPSRALSPLQESNSTHTHHRPQFLDESHVFWCHSCRGDLVIL